MKINSKLVKKLAHEHGFDDCGITNSLPPEKDILFYEKWITSGKNAGMDYLTRNIDIRKNPELLVPEAKTIISLILSYNISAANQKYFISKYARGKDYHHVMKSKLKSFEQKLINLYPDLKSRIFTDSAPVLERVFARESGLGFIGKNTCLIHPKFGSFVFIGEIICDAEAEYDQPVSGECGECNLCIKACPVGALSRFGLDANKCISYHTIENPGEIPEHTANKIKNQVFGCDICQDVCPYNENKPISKHKDFYDSNTIKSLNPKKLENMTNSQFKKHFISTSLYRAGKRKLIENFKLVENKMAK